MSGALPVVRPLPPTFSLRVVGVTFAPDYPENLLDLYEIQKRKERRGAELPALVLIREPDNRYDPNAIAVHAPSIGMLGHLPRGTAERMAPEIDAGTEWAARLVGVAVHQDNPEQPGLEIRCFRVERD